MTQGHGSEQDGSVVNIFTAGTDRTHRPSSQRQVASISGGRVATPSCLPVSTTLVPGTAGARRSVVVNRCQTCRVGSTSWHRRILAVALDNRPKSENYCLMDFQKVSGTRNCSEPRQSSAAPTFRTTLR